ncbi:MAG: aminotransferase class V-fold PLP-dependent enzyme, partial [Eubacterium sp.]
MDRLYFDNGATSFPKAPGLGAAVGHYLEDIGTNINRSSYAAATTAALTALETREQLARLFHFGDPSHVIFTSGVTMSLNLVIKGLLKPGDHAIVSSMEHNATMRPLVQLAAQGVTFDRIPGDDRGQLDAQSIIPLIRPN